MEAQRSPEWFESRRGRITASSVGAIMGLAPYATRDDVMRRMVREYHNAPNEFTGNVATEYGTFHEEGAISEFEMETGYKVEPAPFVKFGQIYGASPDGYVSDGRLIEVKCPYGLRNGGEFKSIDDQKHYYAQIQMQLLCTGHDECYFYQWSPHGTKAEIVVLDEIFIAKMCKEVNEFYGEYILERELPNAEKHLSDKTKKVFDSEKLNETMKSYQFLKIEKERIDEKMKEYLAEMVALTDNEGGSIYGYTLFKTERAGSISYAKAIKELLPDADLEKWRGSPSVSWSVK